MFTKTLYKRIAYLSMVNKHEKTIQLIEKALATVIKNRLKKWQGRTLLATFGFNVCDKEKKVSIDSTPARQSVVHLQYPSWSRTGLAEI